MFMIIGPYTSLPPPPPPHKDDRLGVIHVKSDAKTSPPQQKAGVAYKTSISMCKKAYILLGYLRPSPRSYFFWGVEKIEGEGFEGRCVYAKSRMAGVAPLNDCFHP